MYEGKGGTVAYIINIYSMPSDGYSRIQFNDQMPEYFRRTTQNRTLKIFSLKLRGGSSGLSVSSSVGMP